MAVLSPDDPSKIPPHNPTVHVTYHNKIGCHASWLATCTVQRFVSIAKQQNPTVFAASEVKVALNHLKASSRMAQTTAKTQKSLAMFTMTRTNCPSFCCAGGR